MLWWMTAALAGVAQVDVLHEGDFYSVRIDHLSPCAASSVEQSFGDDRVAISVRVRPSGQLLNVEVDVDVETTTALRRKRTMTTTLRGRPTFLLANGEQGTASLVIDGHSEVMVVVDGFDHDCAGQPMFDELPPEDPDATIEALADDRYAISPRALERFTNDTDELLRGLPWRAQDGVTTGIRLAGIRRDSLPRAMGLRNGDALLTVDGQVVASVEALAEALAALTDDGEVIATLDRAGRTVTLRYTLAEAP